MRRHLALAALCLGPLCVSGCARQECDFHSQCGELSYCENGRCHQDCQRDFDCPDGERCSEIGMCLEGPGAPDGGVDGGSRPDGGEDAGHDSGPGGADAGPGGDAGGGDAGPAAVDSGPPVGRGGYLDRCDTGGDCASGQCVQDTGGSSGCTISCARTADCASEHLCAADGQCRHDDTGAVCSVSAPASCAAGLCLGTSASRTGHCTRDCGSAADCPAGYACAELDSRRVCVDIERPCEAARECETGLCLPAQGCTAACRTAADCPARLSILPAYTCEVAFGSTAPICVPPPDIMGADPIGASCPAVGANSCRSGACDTSAPTGSMCTQACSQEGGCADGLGCLPQIDGGAITLACARAGSRPIGAACGTGRECDSGLCDTGGYCSRLCTDDGLCPSDMRCTPVAGFSLSLCRR